ncbi:hypothetical protein AXE80_07000 [Wenyingzhuangia fucanilytica]|uniref:Uncharacterized protein n=1 Tax=Wenyingzhuangia fucanilytica TaxID=1790137 RepID=A0A1B1Y5K8_9FLAO|nr:hypothetical protein [Wenyingzhuangia fucanilytica]ANW96040.1 hypothetical protein AXE80_07000 [Wenyingzhuangia fucanilytica]
MEKIIKELAKDYISASLLGYIIGIVIAIGLVIKACYTRNPKIEEFRAKINKEFEIKTKEKRLEREKLIKECYEMIEKENKK